MPQASTSGIRAFVVFKESTIFAGDDLECTITFKNIENLPDTSIPSSSSRPPLGSRTNSQQNPNPTNQDPTSNTKGPTRKLPSRAPSVAKSKPSTPRPTATRADSNQFTDYASNHRRGFGAPNGGSGTVTDPAGIDRDHGRKISIISLGSEGAGDKTRSPITRGKSGGAGHARSASLASIQTSFSKASPNYRSPSFPAGRFNQTPHPLSATFPPSSFPSRRHNRHQSDAFSPGAASAPLDRAQQPFKFPPVGAARPNLHLRTESAATVDGALPPTAPIRKPSPRTPDDRPTAENTPAINRVFSIASTAGTPRSSIDLYNTNNNSNETLFSDYSAQQPSSRLLQNPLGRKVSQMAQKKRPRGPETLMMGHVQISGTFTLDSSLVNPSPFEEVKRRAVVGGQSGGGVVGIERSGRENGLFGGITWGSIGESIGGLLGSGQPSSIQEMKGIAGNKSVPLISTSKSILFVDLKLGAGESRTYKYSFKLPRGLPPSHRGRAMKVEYKLMIGTQRPLTATTKQQQMRQIEIPFRVFGGVNNNGEPLGHDLMNPYLILQDRARTAEITPSVQRAPSPQKRLSRKQRVSIGEAAKIAADEFQSYVTELLEKPRQSSSAGLLSPTAEQEEGSKSLTSGLAAKPRELSASVLIDMALRQAPTASTPIHFTIARSGVTVATIHLARSLLKLGDQVNMMIDFTSAKLRCFALEATLESSETVDSALAIRSAQSVERATRRVWGRSVENVLWSQKCAVRMQVPVAGTPTFSTTGVGCNWCVRVEMVVAKHLYNDAFSHTRQQTEEESEDDLDREAGEASAGQASTGQGERQPLDRSQSGQARGSMAVIRHAQDLTRAEQLLLETSSDERGRVFAAIGHLPCETFEVTVPLRVYGAPIQSAYNTNLTDPKPEIEGLAV